MRFKRHTRCLHISSPLPYPSETTPNFKFTVGVAASPTSGRNFTKSRRGISSMTWPVMLAVLTQRQFSKRVAASVCGTSWQRTRGPSGTLPRLGVSDPKLFLGKELECVGEKKEKVHSPGASQDTGIPRATFGLPSAEAASSVAECGRRRS